MKKLIMILLACLTFSCTVSQPLQVKPVLSDYLPPQSEWNNKDIWEHNMPGHELKDPCPIECLCPNLFGLKENPCANKHSSSSDVPEVLWTFDVFKAIGEAQKLNKLVLVVFADDTTLFSKKAKLFSENFGARFHNPCVKKEINKHYVPVLVDKLTYYLLRATSRDGLYWMPGDYFKSPSIMFLKTFKDKYTGLADAYALPITFEGMPQHFCRTLKGFWVATR